MEEGDALWKEVEELKDRIKAMEKEVNTARAERDKSKEVTQKVCGFLGNPGDVLNKARLYDHDLKQPSTDSGQLRSEDGEDLEGAACASPFNRSPTGTSRNARSWAQHHPCPNYQPQLRYSSGHSTGSPAAGANSSS